MRVGVAKEIKTDEYRVALTPAGARELIQRRHEVLVETTAEDAKTLAGLLLYQRTLSETPRPS